MNCKTQYFNCSGEYFFLILGGILLRANQGFWRSDKKSDHVAQCYKNEDVCLESDEGPCVEGY